MANLKLARNDSLDNRYRSTDKTNRHEPKVKNIVNVDAVLLSVLEKFETVISLYISLPYLLEHVYEIKCVV